MEKKVYKVRQIYGNEEIRFDDFDQAVLKSKMLAQVPKSKGVLLKEITYNDSKVVSYKSFVVNKYGEVKRFEIK